MTDTLDSNSENTQRNREQVIELSEEIQTFIVKGEVPRMYEGEMEVEAVFANNSYTISTLRYRSTRSLGPNPLFKVECPSTAVSSIIPRNDRNWHAWKACNTTPISMGTTYKFVFIFTKPSSGLEYSDSVSVTFGVGAPPQ